MKKSKFATSVAALAAGLAFAGLAKSQSIEFWTQHYADKLNWNAVIAELIEDFEAESGIQVNHEVVPWSAAFHTKPNKKSRIEASPHFTARPILLR